MVYVYATNMGGKYMRKIKMIKWGFDEAMKDVKNT